MQTAHTGASPRLSMILVLVALWLGWGSKLGIVEAQTTRQPVAARVGADLAIGVITAGALTGVGSAIVYSACSGNGLGSCINGLLFGTTATAAAVVGITPGVVLAMHRMMGGHGRGWAGYLGGIGGGLLVTAGIAAVQAFARSDSYVSYLIGVPLGIVLGSTIGLEVSDSGTDDEPDTLAFAPSMWAGPDGGGITLGGTF